MGGLDYLNLRNAGDLTSVQLALKTELERIRNFTSKKYAQRPTHVYSSAYDFVLQHGEWWDERPLPSEYEYGLPKLCHTNAISAAVLHGLTYVEGYGMMAEIGLPILHAWNVDSEGLIVDTTWRAVRDETGERIAMPGGAAYVGVRFSVGRGDDALWNGDACVLDDWKRDWPLFREPWEGEDFDREWPNPSPLLRALQSDDPGAMYDAWLEAKAEIARD